MFQCDETLKQIDILLKKFDRTLADVGERGVPPPVSHTHRTHIHKSQHPLESRKQRLLSQSQSGYTSHSSRYTTGPHSHSSHYPDYSGHYQTPNTVIQQYYSGTEQQNYPIEDSPSATVNDMTVEEEEFFKSSLNDFPFSLLLSFILVFEDEKTE